MNQTSNPASRVPRFTFSDQLQEQERQLKDNPLLKRFKESRRRLAEDPHRPIYHFTSPECTMHDPNGLCYWQGRWHLFYQALPPEEPERQHWGHAVSEDLLHWRDLPYAIYPHLEERCFSGNILVEKDRAIAHYHGRDGVGGNYIALSSDPLLLNWKKLSDHPVVPQNPPPAGLTDYQIFDPFIWKKDGMYYSLSGSRAQHPVTGIPHRANFLFQSPDLKHWKYLHEFVDNDVFSRPGDTGHCPYFLPVGDRHILIYFGSISGASYLLGDYDKSRDKFMATSGGNFNFGPRRFGAVHAPSAYPDGKGGLIAIFNMNHGIPVTNVWRDLMTLPRRVTLSGKNELAIAPAGNIESLRGARKDIRNLKLPANQEVVLDSVRGNAMEIVAEIDINDSLMVEMNVLRSRDKSEYTRICFFKNSGFPKPPDVPTSSLWYGDQVYSLIGIDASHSSSCPDLLGTKAPENAPVYLHPDESLRLRVFIDKSVVEVFVNDKQCIAQRVYPGPESLGVSLRSQGRGAVLNSLTAYQMEAL